jgi:hypothetical protein
MQQPFKVFAWLNDADKEDISLRQTVTLQNAATLGLEKPIEKPFLGGKVDDTNFVGWDAEEMNQVTSGSVGIGDYESGSAKGQRQENVHQQAVFCRESFGEALPVDIVDSRDQRTRSCQGRNVLDMEQVNSVGGAGSREQKASV